MSRYDELKDELSSTQHTWLVTGAAGFIGSNLVEALLRMKQRVIGLDNFASGFAHNLEDVCESVGSLAFTNFRFIRGDIQSQDVCAAACKGADYVLHQAALGSVPRSLEDPVRSHRANVDGTVNMLVAARDANVKRFVFASSSSVYGDQPDLPKVEGRIGNPLSPYALTKLTCELYSGIFSRCYGLETVGLRYFNVFGRRQHPCGPYAAVISKWIGQLIRGENCVINGDGNTSRDFCYIENVVQANLLAATANEPAALNEVYNIACGNRLTLLELHAVIRELLAAHRPDVADLQPLMAPFRKGDVAHSLADIDKARRLLGYAPTHDTRAGLQDAIAWYVSQAGRGSDPNLKAVGPTMRFTRS